MIIDLDHSGSVVVFKWINHRETRCIVIATDEQDAIAAFIRFENGYPKKWVYVAEKLEIIEQTVIKRR